MSLLLLVNETQSIRLCSASAGLKCSQLLTQGYKVINSIHFLIPVKHKREALLRAKLQLALKIFNLKTGIAYRCNKFCFTLWVVGWITRIKASCSQLIWYKWRKIVWFFPLLSLGLLTKDKLHSTVLLCKHHLCWSFSSNCEVKKLDISSPTLPCIQTSLLVTCTRWEVVAEQPKMHWFDYANEEQKCWLNL